MTKPIAERKHIAQGFCTNFYTDALEDNLQICILLIKKILVQIKSQ